MRSILGATFKTALVLIAAWLAWLVTFGPYGVTHPDYPESSVLADLALIRQAQHTYHAQHGVYAPDFETLTAADPPYLDGGWSQPRGHYTFRLQPQGRFYAVRADPIAALPRAKPHYYLDHTGVIRRNPNGPAGPDNPAVTP